MQTIELVSFKLCPFVQRSVITLLKKGVDFKITYIDLADKPDWFLKLSPLGKVPVVKYGDDVLFESAVINEFLDEITDQPLMPSDPLLKAKDRAWIEFGSQVLMDQFRMSVAKDKESYEQHKLALSNKLEQLDTAIKGEYFSGAKFSLVDTAIAPMLFKLDLYKRQFGVEFLLNLPKLSALSNKLMNLDCVIKSVAEDYEQIHQQYLERNESYLCSIS